jgi:hypothetical protein
MKSLIMKKIFFTFLIVGSFSAVAVESIEIKVKFNKLEEAKEFISWMSGQGEQDMQYWMEENMPSLMKSPKYDYKKLEIDFTK